MATARYPYSPADPPAPFVLVNLTDPTTGDSRRDMPALVDTGADQTVIPAEVAVALALPELERETVHGFDGSEKLVATAAVGLQVRDLPPTTTEVLVSDSVGYVIIGRDILNRYTLTLNGPAGFLLITDD